MKIPSGRILLIYLSIELLPLGDGKSSFCHRRLSQLRQDEHEYNKQCYWPRSKNECCDQINDSLEDRLTKHRVFCPEDSGISRDLCKKKSDIIFVLDRSGSIDPRDYDKIRVFLKAIAKSLQIVPPICGSEKDDCHPTRAMCTDISPNHYKCTCKPGYKGDGKNCTDS